MIAKCSQKIVSTTGLLINRQIYRKVLITTILNGIVTRQEADNGNIGKKYQIKKARG